MPHPGHGKGHSLKGGTARARGPRGGWGSSGNSYRDHSDNDEGHKGSSGATCEWCGKFMEGHGYEDYTNEWKIILMNIFPSDGPHDRSQHFGYHEWVICPDCGKAIVKLKKGIEQARVKVLEEKE